MSDLAPGWSPLAEGTAHDTMESTTTRRVSTQTVAGFGVAVGLIGVLLLGLVRLDDGGASARGPATSDGQPTHNEPSIRQAPWRITAFRAGAPGPLARPERRLIDARVPELRALVRTVYGALFLEPERRVPVIRNHFAAPARRAIARLQRLGAPRGAQRVQTLARRARVGISTPSARRAVASVTVRARGRVRRTAFHERHEATLWLERDGGRWSVVAFEVRERPLGRRR